MARGTSWIAKGKDLARITLALERGDVRWASRPAEWLLRNFDRVRFNQRSVVRLMHEHVAAGKPVKGQRNVPGQDMHVWFSMEVPIDGHDRFIKFGIEPEDDEQPGLIIISAHPPH